MYQFIAQHSINVNRTKFRLGLWCEILIPFLWCSYAPSPFRPHNLEWCKREQGLCLQNNLLQVLLSSHIRAQPELCLLLTSFDKNGSFSFKFIIRQNSLLPEALPEFGLTWHTNVARQHNLKEPCGFYIWGRLFPSIWANTQRTAGRLGTNEKEMIWNTHAMLPANQSSMTWQASSFFSSSVIPIEKCLHAGLSTELLWDVYRSLTLGFHVHLCDKGFGFVYQAKL